MELTKSAMPGKGERLLVVDDDPDAREAMQRRLNRRGYSTETVDGGEEALKALEKEDFHLVLLDHNMPGMTGLDLLKLLRATRSETDLPIMMLTAQADTQHVVKAFELGANDYLTKPVDFDVAMVRIVTQLSRRKAELSLRESEQRYSLAVRGANDGLWDWNLRANEIYLSERLKAIAGYLDGEIGINPSEWLGRIHPEDHPIFLQKMEAHLAGKMPEFECEHRLLHRDNSYRWVRARGLAVTPQGCGAPDRIAGSLTDINSSKTTDPLTGLANRLCFDERLLGVCERFQRDPGRSFAVILTDLDQFKLVNDTMGHQAGDCLLRDVAKRMSCALKKTLVARLGGDEFAILLEDLDTPGSAASAGAELLDVLGQPYQIEQRKVFATASIGIFISSPIFCTASEVMRNADTALYRAKHNGRNRAEVFDESMRADIVGRQQMEADLRHAAYLDLDQFEVYYQPKVHIASGCIGGFEALLRWNHPTLGQLDPGMFIPLAEETLLIVPIGRHVLEVAAAQLRRWQKEHPQNPELTLAVNVSTRQLVDPDFTRTLKQLIQNHGIPPDSLCLEITEGTLMDNTELTVVILTQLRELGVQIQIDDFGTGYSSLAYVSRFPLHGLKIDRSFVQNLLSPGNDLEIIKSIMALAKATGLSVVAEGIETLPQAKLLESIGCLEGQGFYYARPLTANNAESMLTAGKLKEENEISEVAQLQFTPA